MRGQRRSRMLSRDSWRRDFELMGKYMGLDFGYWNRTCLCVCRNYTEQVCMSNLLLVVKQRVRIVLP